MTSADVTDTLSVPHPARSPRRLGEVIIDDGSDLPYKARPRHRCTESPLRPRCGQICAPPAAVRRYMLLFDVLCFHAYGRMGAFRGMSRIKPSKNPRETM